MYNDSDITTEITNTILLAGKIAGSIFAIAKCVDYFLGSLWQLKEYYKQPKQKEYIGEDILSNSNKQSIREEDAIERIFDESKLQNKLEKLKKDLHILTAEYKSISGKRPGGSLGLFLSSDEQYKRKLEDKVYRYEKVGLEIEILKIEHQLEVCKKRNNEALLNQGEDQVDSYHDYSPVKSF